MGERSDSKSLTQQDVSAVERRGRQGGTDFCQCPECGQLYSAAKGRCAMKRCVHCDKRLRHIRI
jgi:hypothetical protein